MTGHTPGQWAVHDAGTELSVVVVAGSYRLHIATIADKRTGRTEADDANARLIAAAPDGLEAAQFALSVLRANPVEQSERLAIEKLEAFIAKATVRP